MRRALALAVVVLGVFGADRHGGHHPEHHPARPVGARRVLGRAARACCPPRRRRRCTTASPRSSATSPTRSSCPSTDGTGYYKSAALVDENDPSLITNDTVAGTAPGVGAVSARIKRDAYGVPHIYSDTDAGVIFAAGYVEAQDRTCCSTRRAPTASPG